MKRILLAYLPFFLLMIMGRIVKQKLLTEKSANLNLDINDWLEGIYWVELKLDNGSNVGQKVSILR